MELKELFEPKSIAVIGASNSRGKVGHSIFKYLIRGRKKVYPVNIKSKKIMGQTAYPSVLDIRNEVDLAIFAIPAAVIPGVMKECVQKKIKAAIIVSGGFSESGNVGLEHEVIKTAKEGNIKVLGPNCLGIIMPYQKLNASFFNKIPDVGGISFVSQSGALGVAILDWAIKNNIGLSSFISIGNAADVSFADIINYLKNDEKTKAVCLYIESLKDGRSFLKAAEELKKPIIVLKAGSTASGAKAAFSHTAALATEDRIFDGIFKQFKIIRVETLYQLFEVAKYFVNERAPKGKRGVIVTNAGGPGVLASDAFEKRGLQIVQLPKKVLEEMDKVLPEHWSHNNPVDIVGDALPDRYEAVFNILKHKKDFLDFVFCILTPQEMTQPSKVAQIFTKFHHETDIPCFGCFMGGELVEEAQKILTKNHILNFDEPEYGALVVSKMVRK
jgi:acetyltransferase